MKRGDLVTIALQGDFGKPRPALVIQSDQFSEHATVTVLLLSSTLVPAPLLRITVSPSPGNGLRRDRLGARFGRIDDDTLIQVERSLALFLGIAK